MLISVHLLTDILPLIASYVISGKDSNLESKKLLIPLLAVCHEWRAIIDPIFYNYVCFQVYSRQNYNLVTPRTYFEAHTNIDLILQNGCGDKVRNLKYVSKEKEYAVDSLLLMARMLGISASSCSELDSLAADYGINSDNPMDWDDEKHISAINIVATTFASKFSRINQMVITIDNAHAITTIFLSALTDCFADKLVGFNYEGPLRFSNKLPMTGLETIFLIFTEDNQARMYPPICPQSIKTLVIYLNDHLFDWNMFSAKDNSADIVFDQLKHLYCENNNSGGGRIGGPDIDYRLRFPNIVRTTVYNLPFSANIIERQLQSGLQRLRYTDKLSRLLDLSTIDLSGLKCLELEFCGPNSTEEEKEFVALSNKLFFRAKGIQRIQCIINEGILSSSFITMYWPNLTQLELWLCTIRCNIFEAALQMPQLVYLELSFCDFDIVTVDIVLTYIKNLRNNFIEPSNSNITSLKVDGFKEVYYDQIMSSINELKWFWPKLTAVDVSL